MNGLLPLDISDVLNYRKENIDNIEKIATELILLTSTAARLPRKGEEPSYYEWLMNPRKAELDLVIQKKRITREQVEQVLACCLLPVGDLRGLSPWKVANLPRGMELLDLKNA